MTQVVTFNYSGWALRYPELSGSVGAAQAQMFFDEATLYCDNTPCSIIKNVAQRTTLLNMLTAHIAALNASFLGLPPSPLVGRISNAAEGSVNVAVQNDYPPGSVQWYQQSKYGAAFWAATASFRTMVYVPGRLRGRPWGA
jgi:Protein of unknown function (DUF4054)